MIHSQAISDPCVTSKIRPLVPQGAYYVLAGIAPFGFRSASEAATSLLEEGRVAAIPGTAFFDGDEGNGWLRFCFAKDDDALAEAGRRLVAWGTARRKR